MELSVKGVVAECCPEMMQDLQEMILLSLYAYMVLLFDTKLSIFLSQIRHCPRLFKTVYEMDERGKICT